MLESNSLKQSEIKYFYLITRKVGNIRKMSKNNEISEKKKINSVVPKWFLLIHFQCYLIRRKVKCPYCYMNISKIKRVPVVKKVQYTNHINISLL